MPNRENLKSIADRPKEEARAIQSKGGKKSAESRRKKRDTKALYRAILSMPIKTTADMKKALKKVGYDAKEQGDPSVEEVIGMVIASQAMQGDIASARYLNDYAQNPDMRTVVEKERIRAMTKRGAKVDLTVNTAEDVSIMDEIRARMSSETSIGAGDPA